MKASIILCACFVVISADSVVEKNNQQSSSSSVATHMSNTFKGGWQAPNVYSRYPYINPGILSTPGSDIRPDYNWWYSPYTSVQWGVQQQWQPNYDQQRFVNPNYASSSAGQSATNSLGFEIYGHSIPPASYLLKRLEERLMSYGFQSSYRYEGYWDSIVAQFIEQYINENPGFKLILKEHNKNKIFGKSKDIITSMIKYLKRNWNIRWLNANQKADLIAQLESNMVSPDVLNFLNHSEVTAEINSKKQSSKEISEQKNHNSKQHKIIEEKHTQSKSLLKKLNADNNQNKEMSIVPIPPFQIPSKLPQMPPKGDKFKEASVEHFKTDKEKSQQESSSQRRNKEPQHLIPSSWITTIRPPTYEMEFVNGVPAKGFPYSPLKRVPLPQIFEPPIYDMKLEHGYRPYPSLRPVPLPQIVEPPSYDVELENGYHPQIFPYPPLRPVPLPQIVEPPTYGMGLENDYGNSPKGFPSPPVNPFLLPETVQPPPYDMGLNNRPEILPYPVQPVKPSYPGWIYGDKFDDNKKTIPIPTNPNKPDCDKLAEIFKDITNILSNKSLDEEKDNLKLLFKIIKIFIAHNRLDNEPFGVAVDEIGSRLFKHGSTHDKDNRELETGQKLLETEFQSGDISRLLKDARYGRVKDILVFIEKLQPSIEQFKQTLITRKFSEDSIKVLLIRAIRLSAKAGEHFLEECRRNNANLISSTLSLALHLNPEEAAPLVPVPY